MSLRIWYFAGAVLQGVKATRGFGVRVTAGGVKAFAEAAGEEWPQRARNAAIAAVRISIEDGNQSTRVGLLSDLKTLFDRNGSGALFSAEIVSQLVGMEDRGWAQYYRGKPLIQAQLARLLKPFGVTPGSIRHGDKTAKGYGAKALADAFQRYLPDQAVTPSQPAENEIIW